MSYRVRVTFPNGATGVLASTCPTREEALRLILELQEETGLAYAVDEAVATAAVPDARPEPATPEARIRELEAELAHLRDAYDAARQDLEVAMRRLAIAEDIGDAMHRAMTTAQTYLAGERGGVNVALANWSGYRDGITDERQGPAKASGGTRGGSP